MVTYPITITLKSSEYVMSNPANAHKYGIDVEADMFEDFVKAAQAIDPTLSRFYVRGLLAANPRSIINGDVATLTIPRSSASAVDLWSEFPVDFLYGLVEGKLHKM